jgi:pSer/pThr/pTyr-binding forkhead associated (FHA) protein
MVISSTTPLFQKKAFPFSNLDGLCKKVCSQITDCYVTASDGESTRYLFVIDGKPYAAGVSDSSGKSTTSVKDFFTHYKARGSADIELFKADKKVLLCMLVTFIHKPARTFTTDAVNLEDVVKKLGEEKKDAVISMVSDSVYSFAIFIRGQAASVYLPDEAEGKPEETPLKRLISYPHRAGEGKPLTVDMYEDTKVVPSPDAVEFPPEGIAAYYTKEAAGEKAQPEKAAGEKAQPEKAAEANIELIKEGKVTARFPLKVNLTIGREDDNDIHLEEAGVSRHHAMVREAEGKIIIEDLKSTNGTFFKGIRIEKKELNHGDEINIREYTLRLDWPAGAKKVPGKTVYAKKPSEDKEPLEEKQTVLTVTSLVMDDGTAFPLGSITTIGNDEEADIKVEGMLVAKRHAVIIRGKDLYKLVRKSGLSSVKVNGEKVNEQVLKHGDLIEIGSHIFTFMAVEG